MNLGLTNQAGGVIIPLHVEKGRVGIGVPSVCWRSQAAPKFAAFSMVGCSGELQSSPFPASGNANPVRPTTRNWRFCGRVQKTYLLECFTMSAITISDINTTVNHVPRIHDLRLAEALGFQYRYDIRQLIRKHASALKNFGELVFGAAPKTSKGGRPGKEYWLNEEQALYICTKSDAPNAIRITIEMVRVFHAVQTGKTINVRAHVRRKPQKALSRTPEQFAASIPQSDLLTTGLGHLAQAAEAHPELRLIQTANACLKRFDEALNRPLSLSMIHHVVSQGGRA